MNTSISTRKATGAAPCGCSGTAVASACSCAGAGCASCQTQGYVRPHFFAGQLLTEDDLQALSDYVVNKSRLHNRQFMGDGVVCGLAVTCNPCGSGKLVVHPGHALDCCGNDLVLECAVELDANVMVRDMRRNGLGSDCGDPCADRTPNGARLSQAELDQVARHYCLYLHYDEEQTDPVAPYSTDEPCGTTGCEYTRIREGVRFELRCGDDDTPAAGFWKRALACLSDLTRAESLTLALQKLAAEGATGAAVIPVKEALLDLLDNVAQPSDCRLRADVAAIQVPPTGASTEEARKQLLAAYVRMLRDCICRAMLPPCTPCNDTGVLLACIEMAECQVIDICNLERKFVLTGPNLRYWLPLEQIGKLLELACCADIGERKAIPPRQGSTEAPQERAAGAAIDGATGAPDAPASPAPATDFENVLEMLGAHLLKTFGLSAADDTHLGHIAENLAAMFKDGDFDYLLPARILRRFPGSDVREALSGGVLQSSAFRHAVELLDTQHAERVDAAREEIRAESAHKAQSLEEQNRQLQAELQKVLERLDNLEREREPNPPADDVKKTRK